MARAARSISAVEFIQYQLENVHEHPHGKELFARFLVDSIDSGDSRQLSEASINDIFSGKMKRPEMRSLVEEIGAKGEVGRLCWSLGKIDEAAKKRTSGLSAEEQVAATKLTSHCRMYLQDYSYFLNQAIENKTERKASGGIMMKLLGSGAIPRTEGDPDRPKIPAEEEVRFVMDMAQLEVLSKKIADLKIADLERRLAELKKDIPGTGRGGSAGGGGTPTGGAASASAASFAGGRGRGGRDS